MKRIAKPANPQCPEKSQGYNTIIATTPLLLQHHYCYNTIIAVTKGCRQRRTKHVTLLAGTKQQTLGGGSNAAHKGLPLFKHSSTSAKLQALCCSSTKAPKLLTSSADKMKTSASSYQTAWDPPPLPSASVLEQQ
jgi:hypothetical protein